ncbi:portal protein [Labrenzia sp. C1B10]|uniref:phage portal protein n=1 Tax=unclassified Labrenzia TaxID=2648686 RepID=UPI0003B85F75|nr:MULTISPECIES: phage portal protein [unclassified Labrenzia]ERP95649.1 portal protein [Labrenzia sp. C1B10]ERS05715.1 portal protein [Labrenzia sp. C1B70]
MSFLDKDLHTQRLIGLDDQAPSPASVEVLPADAGDDGMIAGGAYDGASRHDREVALWHPPVNSADGDILFDKELIDSRAKDVVRNDSYVSGASKTLQDNIVGAMFFLNSKPNWKYLGLDETWAQEFQEEVETKFTLTAESPNNWLDASRKKTFSEFIRMAVGVHLFTGETLVTAEWIRQADRPYNTAVQMVDTDRLSTPPGMIESRFLRAGVSKDRYGAPVGYHIQQTHPQDWTSLERYTWKYIPTRKPWGRMQVIHIFEELRPDQSRGVSAMVTALSEMRMTKSFRKIVLQNAVVNATYAASIESDMPTETIYQILGSNNLTGAEVSKMLEAYASGYLGSLDKYIGSKGMAIDGVKIPHFFPGTRLNLRPAGQGGPLGTEFESSLLRYIAANLGLTYEQLSKDFSDTNYSGHRAAMAETWKSMQSKKKSIADRLATHIFHLWLEEAISRGDIESLPRRAPNFWEGLNREAYGNCEWVGASRGQVDELKETQAAALRIRNGLSTYEDELSRLGKDWRQVFEQQERERRVMSDRGLVLQADNMLNAASGDPREVSEDE